MKSRIKRTLGDHPKLLAQCHPTLNVNLRLRGKIISLSEIPEQSTLRVCWKCDVASDHIWPAVVYSRTKGSGCPFCTNRPGCVSITNSIPENYPKIAEEWHPTKNSKGMDWWTCHSNQKVWWRCSKCGCEWDTSISKRTQRNQGCPCCSNPPKRVTPHNCLASREDLSIVTALWDYEKNKNLEWRKVSILPVMNVDGTENMTRALTPETITPFSNERNICWICSKDEHRSFKSAPRDMARSMFASSRGCPYCARKLISRDSSFGAFIDHYNLEIEWSEKNRKSPYAVFVKSNKKYDFECPNGPDHKWSREPYAIVNNQLAYPNSNGCPFCNGKEASITNRLDLLYPELAKEWQPDNPMGPDDVTYGYNGPVNWKCKKGHVWTVAANNRLAYDRKREVSEYGIQIYWTKGCKKCKLLWTSMQEKRLAFEFYALFGMETDKTDVRIAGSNFRPDILISPNGLRNRGIISDVKGLIIEWDSHYAHKFLKDRQERDREKSDELERLQYVVIRIREDMDLVNPENDVKVKRFEIKNIVDEVTKKIEGIFAMKIPVFETYRKSESLLDKEAEEKINDLLK